MYPQDNNFPKSEIKKHENTWKSIQPYLDNMKEGVSYNELLLNLKLTEETQFLTIRSSINSQESF